LNGIIPLKKPVSATRRTAVPGSPQIACLAMSPPLLMTRLTKSAHRFDLPRGRCQGPP
jgi:hypothetical protein